MIERAGRLPPRPLCRYWVAPSGYDVFPCATMDAAPIPAPMAIPAAIHTGSITAMCTSGFDAAAVPLRHVFLPPRERSNPDRYPTPPPQPIHAIIFRYVRDSAGV